ncbi:MAG: MerR family DNA-binding protein [Bacteroidota bacterium]
MLIGELMQRSGLTRDAIRFYERKGLIKLDKRQRRDNNYKEYPEHVLQRLILIKAIKEFGFTIKEIRALFDQWEEENSLCSMVDKVDDKVAQIDEQMERLKRMRDKLTLSAGYCRAGGCKFEGILHSN